MTGIVNGGPYEGQRFIPVKAAPGFANDWWTVILYDKNGDRAERDVRVEFLEVEEAA